MATLCDGFRAESLTVDKVGWAWNVQLVREDVGPAVVVRVYTVSRRQLILGWEGIIIADLLFNNSILLECRDFSLYNSYK